MSEKRRLSEQDLNENCESQIQQHHESVLPEEMLGELWDWLEDVDDANFDQKEMDARLSRLETAGFPMPEVDVDAAWVELQKKQREANALLSETVEKSRKRRRRYPFVRIALVALVGFFGCVVAVQALGFDIFGAIGRWTEKTFHFESVPSDVQSQQDLRNEAALSALRTALEECGVPAGLALKQIPDGFIMDEPIRHSNDQFSGVFCSFTNDERFFSIEFEHYHASKGLDAATFEKDASDVELYANRNQTFYVLSNMNSITATWAADQNCVIISGALSQHEIKQIIDSMGEDEK